MISLRSAAWGGEGLNLDVHVMSMRKSARGHSCRAFHVCRMSGLWIISEAPVFPFCRLKASVCDRAAMEQVGMFTPEGFKAVSEFGKAVYGR